MSTSSGAKSEARPRRQLCRASGERIVKNSLAGRLEQVMWSLPNYAQKFEFNSMSITKDHCGSIQRLSQEAKTEGWETKATAVGGIFDSGP